MQESNRILRVEEAALRAGLSIRQLDRELKRLGIAKQRVGWRDVGVLESDVARVVALRNKAA